MLSLYRSTYVVTSDKASPPSIWGNDFFSDLLARGHVYPLTSFKRLQFDKRDPRSSSIFIHSHVLEFGVALRHASRRLRKRALVPLDGSSSLLLHPAPGILINLSRASERESAISSMNLFAEFRKTFHVLRVRGSLKV